MLLLCWSLLQHFQQLLGWGGLCRGSKSESSATATALTAVATVMSLAKAFKLQVQGGQWLVPNIHSSCCQRDAKSEKIALFFSYDSGKVVSK